MGDGFHRIQAGREQQRLRSSIVHDWYRFVLSYPDHLIEDMLSRFDAAHSDVILDPFCGTGTTLVECKKMGMESVGIDSNPASVLASQVKTDWSVDPGLLCELADSAIAGARPVSDVLLLSDKPLFSETDALPSLRTELLANSPEGQYLVKSGMIRRGWVDEIPFLVSIALLAQIKDLGADRRHETALRVALASCMVETVANVRFGPELYVVAGSGSYDVLSAFRSKVSSMADDLSTVAAIEKPGAALVLEGDSRDCDSVLHRAGVERIDHVITSPPYPTEKDYTRQTRLELVYLGFVHDSQSLRQIKKRMVRSHSKGIYKDDSDGELVAEIPSVRAIADELREKVKEKTYGFAKLYPRIIEEYFGGMYRHLGSLSRVIRPGGYAAYVVGEQRTYLRTFTPTGSILAEMAERPELGYQVADVLVWRVRRGTTGSRREIKEEIVVLRKP